MFTSFDSISKKIISLAVSVSMILLAASLFIFSIQQASAKTPDNPGKKQGVNGTIPAGTYFYIVNGVAYFFDESGDLKKRYISEATY